MLVRACCALRVVVKRRRNLALQETRLRDLSEGAKVRPPRFYTLPSMSFFVLGITLLPPVAKQIDYLKQCNSAMVCGRLAVLHLDDLSYLCSDLQLLLG